MENISKIGPYVQKRREWFVDDSRQTNDNKLTPGTGLSLFYFIFSFLFSKAGGVSDHDNHLTITDFTKKGHTDLKGLRLASIKCVQEFLLNRTCLSGMRRWICQGISHRWRTNGSRNDEVKQRISARKDNQIIPAMIPRLFSRFGK